MHSRIGACFWRPARSRQIAHAQDFARFYEIRFGSAALRAINTQPILIDPVRAG
jgi:hypothetical protein